MKFPYFKWEPVSGGESLDPRVLVGPEAGGQYRLTDLRFARSYLSASKVGLLVERLETGLDGSGKEGIGSRKEAKGLRGRG